jgi:D-alanyl-D-alanine dipeptidase
MHSVAAGPLVDLGVAAPGVLVQLRYAAANNFLRRRIYRSSRAYLRPTVAARLVRADRLLRAQGLRLVVWDAWRPVAAQRAMWRAMPDPRFVAPPWRGSRHSRGAAVDVTLADASGRLLVMPTGFDDFSMRAHADWSGAPREVARRRSLLRAAMVSAGFLPYLAEWWHFDAPDWRRYPIVRGADP